MLFHRAVVLPQAQKIAKNTVVPRGRAADREFRRAAVRGRDWHRSCEINKKTRQRRATQ
jgi:hypothetical protein